MTQCLGRKRVAGYGFAAAPEPFTLMGVDFEPKYRELPLYFATISSTSFGVPGTTTSVNVAFAAVTLSRTLIEACRSQLIKSGAPSPFRSATVTAYPCDCVVLYSRTASKVPSPLPKSTPTWDG